MGFLYTLMLVFALVGVIRGAVWVFQKNWKVLSKLLALAVLSVLGMALINGIAHPTQLPNGIGEVTALVAAAGLVIAAGWGIKQSGNRRWAQVLISLATLGMLAFLVVQFKQGVERSSRAAKRSFDSAVRSGTPSGDSGSTAVESQKVDCDAVSYARRRLIPECRE